MNRMRPVLFLLTLLLPSLIVQQRVFAQVVIVRQPPVTGIQKGTATWSEPYPDPVIVRETGGTEWKGRISAGGRGGQNYSGETFYNVVTDSFVTMIHPLGGDALLSIDAKLLRLQSSIKQNQDYNGTISLDFEKLQFKTSGGFKQTLYETADLNSDDTDGRISASISSGLIKTLPMSLNYQSVWINRSNNTIQTEYRRIDGVKFKSSGTVGAVGIEMDADLEYRDDREEQIESLGSAGVLKIIFPLGEAFGLQLRAVPIYNHSETSVYDIRSTSIESGIGLSWLMNEKMQAIVNGGRIDAWNDGSNTEYDLYQSSWKGGLRIDYKQPGELITGASYTYTKAVGGNHTHDILLPVEWTGHGAVKLISVKGTSNLIRTDSGDRIKDAIDWMFNTAFLPAENMNINSGYRGGYLRLEEEDSWNHKMSINFNHYIEPFLNYRGAYSMSNNQEEDIDDLWTQQYLVGIIIKPIFNYKVYTVDLSETLDINNGPTGDDALSSAVFKISVPMGSELSSRFGFQWEWINRISVDGDPGNYLHYFAGFSVAGKQAPFTLSAEYAFAHGYRGLRHDISSLLRIPLLRGYAMETTFNLNNYEENGQSRLYWLLGLNLVYEF